MLGLFSLYKNKGGVKVPKLINLKVNEVSTVDKAANGQSFVVIKNADNENPLIKMVKRLGEALKNGSLKTSDVEKALDFNTALSADNARDAMWDGFSAFQDSIRSISEDETVTDKLSATTVAFMQFMSFLQSNSVIKAGKKISGDRINALKDLHSQLGDFIAGASDEQPQAGEPDGDECTESKGSVSKVADKPKTPAGHPEGCMCDACKSAVAKSAEPVIDVVKSAEYVSLEKRYQDLEEKFQKRDEADKEIQIRKSFDGIGGFDVEGLMPFLKSIHGTEAFTKFVASEQAKEEQIKKSGLFNEIGSGGVSESSVEKQLEAKAVEIQKSDKCTKEQAFAKACDQNPELYVQHRDEMRGAK